MAEKTNLYNPTKKNGFEGETIDICKNFLDSISTGKDSIDIILEKLNNIRNESYQNEKIFLEEYLKDNNIDNKTLESLKKILKNNDIKEYIDFFKKNKNIFKLLLLRRDFQTGEEQFIKFLYSSDIIDGLPSNKMESFYVDDERIGSKKPISIYDFVSVFMDTFKKQLESITSELSEEYAERIKIKYGDQIAKAVVEDLRKLEITSMRRGEWGGQKIMTGFMKKADDTLENDEYHKIFDNEFLFYFKEGKENNLHLETELLQDEEFTKSMKGIVNDYSSERISLETYKERVNSLVAQYLKDNIISKGNSLYTSIFFDKKEFKKIEKKLTGTRSLIDKVKSEVSKINSQNIKDNDSDNNSNDNILHFDSFVDFIDHQLNKCSINYPGACEYWNTIKTNKSLTDAINNWYNYNSASLVMGHIGESFAKFFMQNAVDITGQSTNKLGQQAHIDLKTQDNTIGLQVKNFSSVVNAFTLYETDISVFGDTISRYIPDNDQIYIKIRFLSLYAEECKLVDKINTKISLILSDNIGNFMRYGDLQSQIENIKNNFYILNFNMIPSSVIINSVIEQIKSKANNKSIFDLTKFPSKYNKSDKITYDLSKTNQNLVQVDNGRIIYNGFKFNLKDF